MVKPIDPSNHRTLHRPLNGDDVVFLHALLNHHLPPPDDQLPVKGSGAGEFGPRTEAKVKRFQKANRIDLGTKFYMDGVVGPHTWKVLTETQQATVTVLAAPQLKLTPPTFPSFPGSIPPVSPVPIPVPKLHLDSFVVQVGEQGTFPFRGGATAAHSVQVVGVILKKNDGFHLEGQFGPTLLFGNRGPGAGTDKSDLGFLAVFNLANLPGSAGRFNWSTQAQLALVKSLSDRSGSGQLSGVVAANLSLIKKGDIDVLQVTTQGGLFLEADAPSQGNDNKWTLKAGSVVFFGLAGTIGGF